MAGLAALVGLMVATNNVYLAETPFTERHGAGALAAARGRHGAPGAAAADAGAHLGALLQEGLAPVPTVRLSPAVVKALLLLDEKDQMALVVDPKTAEERQRQRAIIDHLVVASDAVAPAPTAVAAGTASLAHDEDEEVVTDEHHHHVVQHHLIEEGGGAHELTPAQERASRLWALIFVTFIVTASVIFETCKEIIHHNTPETMFTVVDKFFGELATLGFIGTLAFVFTTGFAGHTSVLGHLSFWYLGDEELLIHEFEIVHFLIFFVMVFFVSAVLVILQIAVSQHRVFAPAVSAAARCTCTSQPAVARCYSAQQARSSVLPARSTLHVHAPARRVCAR